jgi:hypothetical protein
MVQGMEFIGEFFRGWAGQFSGPSQKVLIARARCIFKGFLRQIFILAGVGG